MNIDDPTWTLKSPRCDCCGGQGALCLSACPLCAYVMLICDEVGTVFLDPHDLEHGVYAGLEEDTCVCSKCGNVKAADFRDATAEEIQAAGFPAGTYE